MGDTQKRLYQITTSSDLTSDDYIIGTRDTGGGVYVDRKYASTLFNASSTGIEHLKGTTSAPTATAGGSAGTGATVSVNGDDLGGYITINTGTGCTGGGILANITFDVPYTSAPRCILLSPGSNVTNLDKALVVLVSITTTGFSISAGSGAALTDSSTAILYYLVKQ